LNAFLTIQNSSKLKSSQEKKARKKILNYFFSYFYLKHKVYRTLNHPNFTLPRKAQKNFKKSFFKSKNALHLQSQNDGTKR